MDWELYERYRSTLLLAALLVVSSLLLAFQKSSSVQFVRAFLVRFSLPPQRFLSQRNVPAPDASGHEPAALVPGPISPPVETSDASETNDTFIGEERRRLQVLSEENRRLHEALGLKEDKWPKALIAHVAGRDPQRWFQEIVLDKGKDDGVQLDFPVLAIVEGREALAGRVVEVSAHVSKVMLLQDSLSEVAAVVAGADGEDGIVEGTNTHNLLLKFLNRGSQVKMGDLVMTSGLGKAFPPGIPIGWVEEVEPDPRQLFLQAKLRPAVKSNQLRIVLILAP